MIAAILECSVLKLEDGQRLAGATVVIIMLIGHSAAPWLSALFRSLEGSFGSVVSLLVTRLVWPADPPQVADVPK